LLLSLTAGAVDAIGFLGVGGLFAAHVTGNLAVLAMHFVSGHFGQVAPLIAVPVFAAAVFAVTLGAGMLARRGQPPLMPLLVLHAALLVLLCAVGISFQPFWDPDRPLAVAVGMLAVTAMAVQNATVRIALARTPSTAVMTTNLTQWSVDLAVLAHRRADAAELARARERARVTWPCIAGFLAGCVAGAALQLGVGMGSLALPALLALLCLPLARHEGGNTP
jgi:uncharacterized membrane protein YoaK (UPF0700 family)